MRRAPRRSVSAPTGIRPKDPTITGTATSRACWNELRPSCSRSVAAIGARRAQAQNVTAKPIVAVASMIVGCLPVPEARPPPVVDGPWVPGPSLRFVLMSASHPPWLDPVGVLSAAASAHNACAAGRKLRIGRRCVFARRLDGPTTRDFRRDREGRWSRFPTRPRTRRSMPDLGEAEPLNSGRHEGAGMTETDGPAPGTDSPAADALLRAGRFFTRAETSSDLRAVYKAREAVTATCSIAIGGATTRSSVPRTG